MSAPEARIQPDSWQNDTNWRSLGSAVADLKRRVEAAYHASDADGADEAHDDLVAAEWRLRQAERRAQREGREA